MSKENSWTSHQIVQNMNYKCFFAKIYQELNSAPNSSTLYNSQITPFASYCYVPFLLNQVHLCSGQEKKKSAWKLHSLPHPLQAWKNQASAVNVFCWFMSTMSTLSLLCMLSVPKYSVFPFRKSYDMYSCPCGILGCAGKEGLGIQYSFRPLENIHINFWGIFHLRISGLCMQKKMM